MTTERMLGGFNRKEWLGYLGIATADDPKLAAISAISWTGNALKVLGVNATANGWELAAVASPAWGGITGTLSAQADLQAALDAKAPLSGPTLTGVTRVTGTGLRIEGNGASFAGAGVGMEGFVAGGTFYFSAYNRTSAAYSPLIFLGSAINFQIGGTNGLTIDNGLAVRFPFAGTTASAANAFIDGADGNNLLRSTSSRRYKQAIRPLRADEAEALLKLEPVAYRSRAEADDKRRLHWGFIAEDAAQHVPALIHFDGEGEPDGFQYERVVAGLIHIVKRQQQRLDALERRLGKERE